MKTIFVSAVVLVAAAPIAQADTSNLLFATSSLYLQPDQSIDFLSAVWQVTWAQGTDNYYPLDINHFTFTSVDNDDDSDPIALDQTPIVN